MKIRGHFLFFSYLIVALLTTEAPAQAQLTVVNHLSKTTHLVELTYPEVPEAPKAQSIDRVPLFLRIVNNAGGPVVVDIEARLISGEMDETKLIDSISLDLREERRITLSSEMTSSHTDVVSASQLLITGQIRDASGRRLGATQAPSLFYRRDNAGELIVYRPPSKRNVADVGRVLGKGDEDDRSSVAAFTTAPGGGGTPQIGWLVQICVKLKVNFSDLNYGEDYWTTNADRPAYGVWIRVVNSNGAVAFDNYTGDGYGLDDPGAGCTPTLVVHTLENWSVHINSKAKVKDNFIRVYGEGGPYTADLVWWTASPGPTNLSTSHTNTFTTPSATSESSALAAAIYAIYRNNGGVTNKTYKIFTGHDDSGDDRGSTYWFMGSYISYLGDEESQKKNAVTHHMGHQLLYNKLGATYSDLTFNPPSGEMCRQYGDFPEYDHSMKSKEYSTGAFEEGFAHFYAVVTWNAEYQADAQFENFLTGEVIDVAGSSQYMKTKCASPYWGFGNERDWMTFFWDFYTEPGPKPLFTDILNIIAEAAPMDRWAAYFHMETAATSYQSGAFHTRFVDTAANNGIDP